MVINGIVNEIVFRNGDNNYTVMVINCNGEMITAVGKVPLVNEGENVELTGEFVAHSRYGEQFSISSVKLKPPTTCEGLIRYLSSGLIKGVGVITATKIVNKFRESTLDIIEFNPSRMAEINGISEKKAMEIAEEVNAVKKMQNAVMLMQNYNIGTNLAIKIYNFYGDNTEGVLRTNPYRLTEDVDGIGFFTADKIAQNMGIKEDSFFRFRAGIIHCLKDDCDKGGNTYVTNANLEDQVFELLRVSNTQYKTIYEDVVQDLVNDGVVKRLEKDNDTIYSLTKYFNLEKIVSATLKLYLLNNTEEISNLDGNIDLYEQLNNIKMHSAQRDAVKMAINNGVSIVTGGPGTGKTTIVKCIMQIFRQMGKKVKLLAPTGRAAKRLSESCGTEASTIHRALEVDFGPQMFKYNNLNKLPFDVVIVDEISMVDIQLMYYLIRALKRGAQMVFVGDKDQLPSVGAGNVLSDMLESDQIPKVCLTQIYRQSENSLIITNAHAINNGEMPKLDNSSKDFFFTEKVDTEDIKNTIIDMCVSRIPKYLDIDPSKVQVLAPMKAGICGIDNLNKALQDRLNPAIKLHPEIATERYSFRVGDRVMQTSNNYEREWVKDREKGAGVFNGDIGTITHIELLTNELTVTFEDGRETKYLKGDLNEITLSYAITIHKSQGSEFDVVVMPMIGGPPMLLTRNLLYTGVTRAKKMVVLVGSTACVKRMVKNNYTQKRFTLLKDFLTNENMMLE
jgi:exodeoxyribonuclease V alpha subunit